MVVALAEKWQGKARLVSRVAVGTETAIARTSPITFFMSSHAICIAHAATVLGISARRPCACHPRINSVARPSTKKGGGGRIPSLILGRTCGAWDWEVAWLAV